MTNEQLVALIRAGDSEAENMLALWQQNKGFIYKMAIKYQAYAEIEDLNQEGYIGLCEAVNHYEQQQGVPFISYAAFWIRQAMRRYIDNCCSIVRIPVSAKEEILQYKKIVNEYRKGYGKNPTDLEMRSFLGVSREKLETIKKNALAVNLRSLDECIGGEDEEFSLGDTVASDQNIEDDVIKKLDTAAMKEALWEAIDELPGKNMAEVLRYKYQDKMTLKQIGKSLGVATERARQIERDAMRKLRVPSRNKSFKGYYEQYLAPATIHHVGLNEFKRTRLSSTELEALRELGCL